MKHRIICWGLALWTSAALLAGCAHRAPETAPVQQIVTPEPARAAAAPLLSHYHFEAEKTAMAQGCTGPNQMRPVSKVVRQYGSLEWFEVMCADRVQRVRCDLGMCVPIR
jgi:hypothetical protein